MTMRPNSIILPSVLRTQSIVVVNEAPAQGQLPVGHIDVSFFNHGLFDGTYGRNSEGMDISGKYHKKGKMTFRSGSMPGGVFTEFNARMMSHFVIVSDRNYRSMLDYAQSQAALTVQNKLDYNIFSGNCSDFVYRVFQHSDLPQRYRVIGRYLRNRVEPVAVYAIDEAGMYSDDSRKWSHNRRLVQRGITIAVVTEDLKVRYFPLLP